MMFYLFFFFSSRRRHTRSLCDWSSDVCSSDLNRKDAHPGIYISPLAQLGVLSIFDRKSNRVVAEQRKDDVMPEEETTERAREDEREGKSPSTQAGEFVREEMEHIREGKHGARSTKQAIAIGLSKARRAGVNLPAPKAGQVSARTRHQATRDVRRGRSAKSATPSAKRSRATLRALQREGHKAATPMALAGQARAAARRRKA